MNARLDTEVASTPPPDALSERAPAPRWDKWDAFALAFAATAIVLMNLPTLRNPLRPLSGDMILFFVPLFRFMGEALRGGHIPAWNPHQFMGAPFVADPQSGWMSVLVMLPFSLLPLGGAIVTMVLLHQFVATAATYVFARVLGQNQAGALAAATIFEFTMLFHRTRCCAQIMGVMTWAPVMLLSAELALRAKSAWPRAGWLLLGGLAVSQELSAWLGQGSYYQFLVLAGWIAFRTLIWPVGDGWSLSRRIVNLIVTSVAIVGSGILMNAAALLPRLVFNRVSNVAGGEYQGPEAAWASDHGGFEPATMIVRLVGGYTIREWLYAGAAAFAVALLCIVAAPRWRPWVYFSAVIAAMLALSLSQWTPVETLAFLLPAFEVIHSHYRERITHGITLPVGLLAGATISSLTTTVRRPRLVVAAAVLVLAACIWLTTPPRELISPFALAAVVAALGVTVIAVIAPPERWIRVLLAISFSLIFIWDSSGRMASSGVIWVDSPYEGGINELVAPGGAADVIRQHDPGDWRYFGFDPPLLGEELSTKRGYAGNAQTGVTKLLVAGNQASALGLDDLQGYNPVHPMRYVEWVRALNGIPQLYRFGFVYPSGLDSPLLDLSNVRYAVVLDSSVRYDLVVANLVKDWTEVYADDRVRVVENPEAAPRAWLTDEARVVEPASTLELLASGSVDGRKVALVEDAAAAIAPTSWGASRSAVDVARPNSDQIEIALPEPSGGPAMLVVSETYDAGWRATVDGQPAPVMVVHHTLIGVQIPPGARQVVLTYDPPALRIGLIITLLTFAAAIVVWCVNGWRLIQRRRTR